MKKFIVIILLFISIAVNATTYYCAPTTATPAGSDANAGTIGAPFFTLNKAWTVVAAGDIIYMRGGVFEYLTQQNLSGKNGTTSDTIHIFNYPGETPVLTKGVGFSGTNWGLIVLQADYTKWKGINITGFTQVSVDICSGMVVYHSDHNLFERLEFYHNANGMFIYIDSDENTVKNCDFYHNYDTMTADPYTNGDGLDITNTSVGSNNYVTGCRAWNNSDDGIDFYNSNGYIGIDSSWAWQNGYREDGVTAGGDGNGIKLGRTTVDLSAVFGRRITNCMAFNNRKSGIDQNSANTKMYVYNNISYNNHGITYGAGFYFSTGSLNNAHIFRNNVSFSNSTNWAGVHTAATIDHNSYDASWQPTGPVANIADFASIDTTGISGARQANGTLPILQFLKLASTSDLRDAGIDVGIPYLYTAPDLGAWEFILPNPPIAATVLTDTIDVYNIMFATIGGNVVSDGGGTVSDRGVCWGAAANPTIAGNHAHVGNGTGTFTYSLAVVKNTTYHVRAFATNEVGTSYGADVEFTTPGFSYFNYGGQFVVDGAGKYYITFW